VTERAPVLPRRLGKCDTSCHFVPIVRSSQNGGRPGVRGTRTVRRLLGVGAALALVGPLSSVARPDVAAAAPTGYVTMSDGVSIAVNVRMPTNYIPGQRYPTVFEMSGYDGGSANGGTLAKDVGVPPGTPVPRDDSRQLTDLFNGEYVTVHASVRGTGCSTRLCKLLKPDRSRCFRRRRFPRAAAGFVRATATSALPRFVA